jgi:AraC-like DNA-binding protein
VLHDFGFVYVTEGGGRFRVRGCKDMAVQAGDLLWLRPGVWHDYVPDVETGWREFWVLVKGPRAAALIKELDLPGQGPVFRIGVYAAACRLFAEMLETARLRQPFAQAALAGLTIHLLASLMGRFRLRSEGCQQEHALVQQSRRYLEAHFAEPVDMQALARSLHVSYRQFRRIFAAALGMPPHQYLLHLRLAFAKRMLEEQHVKISVLARQAGFNDSYHFSRLFKRKTGLSPSRWGR